MGNAIVIAGLGFGDEGKGTTVDYLARETGARLVVRYNGGPQAAHNVVTDDGRHHTFAQFGSGAFAGAATHLSRFMLVNPEAVFVEADHLRRRGVSDPCAGMTVDRDALIVTRYHVAANRIRETARGAGRHGSCGMGVGEARGDSLRPGGDALSIFARDLSLGASQLRAKLNVIRELKLAELADEIDAAGDAAAADVEVLTSTMRVDFYAALYVRFAGSVRIVDGVDLLKNSLRGDGTVIFEGAQGVLLDESYGFHPYTTWTDTTFGNADRLMVDAMHDPQRIERLGVLRAMATRHGPGPFVTEDADLTHDRPDAYNVDTSWQRDFRVGHFDAVAVRYALAVAPLYGPIDGLVITHMDLRGSGDRVCVKYGHRERGAISDIAISEKPDLSYQEQLTSRLFEATPVYETPPFDDRGFFEYVEGFTEKPIRLASFGPKPSDKMAVHGLSRSLRG